MTAPQDQKRMPSRSTFSQTVGLIGWLAIVFAAAAIGAAASVEAHLLCTVSAAGLRSTCDALDSSGGITERGSSEFEFKHIIFQLFGESDATSK